MRIDRLDLLRYGKFTDRTVHLPPAGQDLHLIVGPNEAGKSTLRNAILDLLFGIETRSRYNFLHPYPDMRLGARIERSGESLDFVRVKAQRNTLRTPAGDPLPDSTLTAWLGQADRHFFAQMFGLDHQRLVDGGQQILSASNDVGRILFQAAAGIGSLGEIHARLEQEADTLWAPRRSGSREYFKASDDYEQARSDLDQATVRTRDWLEARQKVDAAREALEAARAQVGELEQSRSRLERLRRVAPLLASLREHERQQAELGEVIELPEDASALLEAAERETALAEQTRSVFEKQLGVLREEQTHLPLDPEVLAQAETIEALAARRASLVNHERDIGRREEELRLLRDSIGAAARQLRWPEEDEAALAARLPGRPVCSAIDDLARRHETLRQNLEAAEDGLRDRQSEADAIEADLAALPTVVVPPDLADAAARARALGDVEAQDQRLGRQTDRLRRELTQATLALGEWQFEPEVLRGLMIPSSAEVGALLQQRAGIELQITRLAERIEETRAESGLLELEIRQYRAAHQPVTQADVQRQRAERDDTWMAIRTGRLALESAADDYEQQVADADLLADQRQEKAREAAKLQTDIDRLEGLGQKLAGLESRAAAQAATLTAFDEAWAEQIAGAGLAGLPLLRIESWRAARDNVLQSAAALAEAEAARQDFLQQVEAATNGLNDSLRQVPDCGVGDLASALREAEALVEAARQTGEQRKALTSQQARLAITLAEARRRVDEARQGVAAWTEEWQANLQLAQLPAETTVGAMRGILEVFEALRQQLEKVRDIRANRIDLMRRDLDDFAVAARDLAQALEPALTQRPAGEISRAFEERLREAQTAAREHKRLAREIRTAEDEARTAQNRLELARASLEPLWRRLPGPPDLEYLRVAIQRSDRYRQLADRLESDRRQLLSDGDGLELAALVAEQADVDPVSIPGRLAEIRARIDERILQQNQFAAELHAAETALGRIAGQDEAARAESRRQEALARMGNAVERYLRVRTAARLLRWSIERFRETRQGPMLAHASDIFRDLTDGALVKLHVDHDTNPPTLIGQRPSGATVPIEGMSEGTRDQLYLALRLAALELHLEQAAPLPFIADDLFINYDDGRSRAGFAALARLSLRTQVIFLSHHRHLVDVARSVVGGGLNVVDWHGDG
jgi:uncharacterized protein YhaN